MNDKLKKGWPVIILMVGLLAVLPATALAYISGIHQEGGQFTLKAMDGWVSMGEGSQAYMWGYADASASRMVDLPGGQTGPDAFGPTAPGANPLPGNTAQMPGPVLIVNQGEAVKVVLTNSIPTIAGNTPVCTSIVFPGQVVTASGGVAVGATASGCTPLLTNEAAPGDQVTYTFTATNPGTYTYYSGTSPWLQQEMGLWGVLIVRPANLALPLPANSATAPNHSYVYPVTNGYYDHEYLVATSELDPTLHQLVASGQMGAVDPAAYHPTAWFLNGRNYPDTVSQDYAGWLPAQPYSCIPQHHPLEASLMRIVGGGRNLHPFHTHGQNHNIIARDGMLLQSTAGAAAKIADMPISDYTTSTVAGVTQDAIYGPWTGWNLGWDIFGPPPGFCTNGTFVNSHVCSQDSDCAGQPNRYTSCQQVDPIITTGHTCTPCATNGSACSGGPLASLINFLGMNQRQWAPGFDPNSGEWCGDHYKQIPVDVPAPSKLAFGTMWGGSPYMIPGEVPAIPDPHTGDFSMTQNQMGGISFMWHSHTEREITTNNIFIGGIATMSMVLPYQQKDVSGTSTGPINIP